MENGPVELAGSSMVFFNSSLFVVGGVSNNNLMFQKLLKFDLNTQIWTLIECGSFPSRSKFFAFMNRSKMFLMFGFNERTQVLENSIFSADLSDLGVVKFAQEPVQLVEKFSVFSYGAVSDGSSAYMFGGCSFANITNVFIKYSPKESSAIQVVTSRYPSPRRLMNASLVSISGSLYLFGGMYEEIRYNELWKFDIKKVQWFRLKYYGKIPSPRSHHSAGSDGETMIIFGGRDSISLFNDAYSFNTITLTWNELPYTDRNPSARFGACLMVSLPLIYMYGGEGASSFSVALWRYNMSDSTWFPYEDSYGFQPGTMQGCDLSEDGEIVSILYGTADADKPLGYIQRFNLTSLDWTPAFTPTDPLLSRSSPLIAKVAESYYIIGGSTWASKAHLEVVKINVQQQTATVIDFIDQTTFQSAYVRDKSKIYFYGGGARYDELVRYNMPTNFFYSVDLLDICDNDCQYVCSPGSYFKEGVCELCLPGTFNGLFGKLECKKCPKGTFNTKFGATSQRQCYPCSIGQFSNTEGSSKCRDCETGYHCPIGSIWPTILRDVNLIESVQPTSFKRKTSEASLISFQVQIIGSFLAFSLLLLFTLVKRFRKYVICIDLYDDLHNFDDEVPLVTRKTLFGGVFTFFFLIAAFNLIARSIVMLQIDNIQELKNLIPLVVLSEIAPSISGNIDFIVTFGNYGGECVEKNDLGEDKCSSSIFYSISEVVITGSRFRCELNNLDCIIYLTLENCEIDSATEIDIKLQERFAYTSQIIVNVTSDSSIPNEKSSVRMIAYPANNTVFRGKSPTVFRFSLTPSHFSSDYDSDEYTGYHVSVLSLPSGGTYYDATNLGFTADLLVKISLERSINGLKVERKYILTVFLMVLTLLGSIPGVQQVLGSVMTKVEEQYESLKEKRKKKSRIKKVTEKRIKIKSFLSKKNINQENSSDERQEKKKQTKFKRPSLVYII
jgi:hypothetical protein